MGQIIPFLATLGAYPATTDELEPAGSVFLLSVRWWVDMARTGIDPLPRLRQAMRSAGAHDAALSLDAVMRIVARTASRPLAIHMPTCPCISDDEKHLLRAASLTQAAGREMAERVLNVALLSAQGAEMASLPLDGLGQIFAAARLFFRRRRAVPADAPSGGQRPQLVIQ